MSDESREAIQVEAKAVGGEGATVVDMTAFKAAKARTEIDMAGRQGEGDFNAAVAIAEKQAETGDREGAANTMTEANEKNERAQDEEQPIAA